MQRNSRWSALIAVAILPTVVLGQSPGRQPNPSLLQQRGAQKSPLMQLRAPIMPMSPRGPLPQVPMSDLPSTPPQVTYQNGMLSIVAENSTLGDILREVQQRSGAVIDAPPNATERVVTRLGPGPARDVLASLLNGSAFNYVMVGSPGDPASVAKLILTSKTGGAAAPAFQPPPQQYVPQPVAAVPRTGPGGPVAQAPENDDEADAEDDKEENADDEQNQDKAVPAETNADGGQQPNAGPKTPEQILEMLRQQQQPDGSGQQPPIPRVQQNLQQMQQQDNPPE